MSDWWLPYSFADKAAREYREWRRNHPYSRERPIVIEQGPVPTGFRGIGMAGSEAELNSVIDAPLTGAERQEIRDGCRAIGDADLVAWADAVEKKR